MPSISPFKPIENYGVIGNMCTAALVGVDGSIDFFCFPRFDSPTVFVALLDPEKGGSFSLHPSKPAPASKQMYLAGSNVLLTRFLSEEGIVEITDFMPVTETSQKNFLVRIVRCKRGQMQLQMNCKPAFDYARSMSTASASGNDVLFQPASGKSPAMRLQATVVLKVDGDTATADFSLSKGEKAIFLFGGHAEMPKNLDAEVQERDADETLGYWRKWTHKSQYSGRWREVVSRSALVLKLLSSREFGSIIAAPTFSLPEQPGGERNWDYRYTWMRDAAFTLYALMRLGYREESDEFWKWLGKRIGEDQDSSGPLQVMYGLDGTQELKEKELTHLRGYRDSKPVHIGNGAYDQLQLDIYGEVFDAVYLYSKYGHAVPHDAWVEMIRILDWLGKNWARPDDGIWEIRSGPRQMLHSRLMCWVAFDRAIRLAHKRSLSAPLPEWYKHRDAIAEDMYKNFWDDELQSFVQSKGSKALDASVLLMPLMRFISPIDPKWLSTLNAIETHLTDDIFVHRYRNIHTADGMQGEEGSFTCCAFWLVECLARANQVDKAHLLFEKLLAHGNHLHLFSEELGPDGNQWGNFPQALTHLALISAATFLDRALSPQQPKPWG